MLISISSGNYKKVHAHSKVTGCMYVYLYLLIHGDFLVSYTYKQGKLCLYILILKGKIKTLIKRIVLIFNYLKNGLQKFRASSLYVLH